MQCDLAGRAAGEGPHQTPTCCGRRARCFAVCELAAREQLSWINYASEGLVELLMVAFQTFCNMTNGQVFSNFRTHCKGFVRFSMYNLWNTLLFCVIRSKMYTKLILKCLWGLYVILLAI